MFSFKIDDDTQLRLLEPRHAEELDALIKENNKFGATLIGGCFG